MLDRTDIIRYLELIFNKHFEEITKEEFSSVTTITFEYKDTVDKDNRVGLLQTFQLLPNLKNVTIRSKIITKDLMNELSNSKIEVLSFENCRIRSEISFNNFRYLQELNISKCHLVDYSVLDTISSKIIKIFIKNPADKSVVDIIHFINYNFLTELYLEECVVQNIKYISKLRNLKILSLLWSDITDTKQIKALLNLDNLDVVYLSDCYKDLEEVKELSLQKKVYFDYKHFIFENRDA